MGVIHIFRTELIFKDMLVKDRYLVLEDELIMAKIKLRKHLLSLADDIEIVKIVYDGMETVII